MFRWLGAAAVPFAILVGYHEASFAYSATPSGIMGRTNRDGGAGCQGSGCHTNVTANTTVTISGVAALMPGQSSTYTVTATNAMLGSGINMGVAVASGDSGAPLSESAANLVVQCCAGAKSAEVIHSAAGGALNTTNAGGSASYQFTYTMPAGAAAGSAHTLYAVARLGFSGSWNHATNLIVTTAFAAQCVGFTDVDSASGFCPNVEWLKNRQITLGCTSPTLYCPGDPVNRLAMAAFLNRLGNALEPTFVHAIQAEASAAVNAAGVICQTAPYAVTNYPRVATASTMVYHQSASSVMVNAKAQYSLNSGATWQNFGDFVTFASNVAGGYASQSPVAKPLYLSPGQTVVFGINAAGLATTDAGCELTVRIDSHTGSSSPY